MTKASGKNLESKRTDQDVDDDLIDLSAEEHSDSDIDIAKVVKGASDDVLALGRVFNDSIATEREARRLWSKFFLVAFAFLFAALVAVVVIGALVIRSERRQNSKIVASERRQLQHIIHGVCAGVNRNSVNLRAIVFAAIPETSPNRTPEQQAAAERIRNEAILRTEPIDCNNPDLAKILSDTSALDWGTALDTATTTTLAGAVMVSTTLGRRPSSSTSVDRPGRPSSPPGTPGATTTSLGPPTTEAPPPPCSTVAPGTPCLPDVTTPTLP